jgi:hypothetical protein
METTEMWERVETPLCAKANGLEVTPEEAWEGLAALAKLKEGWTALTKERDEERRIRLEEVDQHGDIQGMFIKKFDAFEVRVAHLEGALREIGDRCEKEYWRLRNWIDERPDLSEWIRGDDAPAYPFRNIQTIARAAMHHGNHALLDTFISTPAEPPTREQSSQVASQRGVLLAILSRIDLDTRTSGEDWGIPHVAKLARDAMEIVRALPEIAPEPSGEPSDTALLDWREAHPNHGFGLYADGKWADGRGGSHDTYRAALSAAMKQEER